MDDVLSCPLCLFKFDTVAHIPHVLSCGHSFCEFCINELIKQQEKFITHLKCPIDKCDGFQSLDIKKIPINKVIIDIIDFNGTRMNSLSIKDTNNEDQKLKYIIAAEDFLSQNISSLNTQIETIKKGVINLLSQRENLLYNITNLFEQIVLRILSDKNKIICRLDSYIGKKLEEMNIILRELERMRDNTQRGISKISILKNQSLKQVTVSDQLLLISEIGIDDLKKENTQKYAERIIWKISNDKFYPIINIKNNIFYLQEQVLNCINVDYPEENIELYVNGKESENEIDLLSNTNKVFSLLKLNSEFIWIQPNSNAIYKYNPIEKWKRLHNSNNHIFTEMFRVCEVSPYSYLITGGTFNNKSSDKVYLYQIDGDVIEKVPMCNKRRVHGVCKINSFIYAVGGVGIEDNYIQLCERYSIENEKWTPIADLPYCKGHVTLCAVNDRHIYSFGGDLNGEICNSIEMYNTMKDEWVALSVFLPFSLECPATCQINEEEIVICGGFSKKYGGLNSVLRFNFKKLQINAMLEQINERGWCVYNPKIIDNKLHILLGGEGGNSPNLVIYELK